ncbi:S-layer homology domain-containing protein [Paenibacillus sp. J5C_2022]|uniref:S-layer homology domain-containing protein n=1 Tax=Paenibacillus sp. J5C2022 TaxID=2977129 RepID=UPI0021CFC54D|nr:S-layer homology domain-containing protein [Paenibacillus sp. J5C2022]MCU6709062.1 S-layer homology domain-containing protein [Paenibacillus sp. J5C2022]
MNKKRWIAALCLTSLLFWLCVPGILFADASPVRLDKPANKHAGETVNISGATTLEEITVKVIRPDGTILYFDIMEAAAGTFSTSFRLPADAAPGTYTIVAGAGSEVASAALTVTEADAGSGTATPPPASWTKDPESGEITLHDSSIHLSRTTGRDGSAETSASVRAEALRQAIAAASRTSQEPLVRIPINGATSRLIIKLPADVLMEAAGSAPATVIMLEGNGASYRLPLSLTGWRNTLSELTETPADANLVIEMSPTSGTAAQRAADAAATANARLINPGYTFQVSVEASGSSFNVGGLGSAYTVRTFTMDGIVHAAAATIALFDESTGTFAFVPALFERRGNATHVTVKHSGNGIYTVLSAERTFRDIAEHWAGSDIELMAAKLIVNGHTANTFAPDAPITRAEFTALIVRGLGIPASYSEQSAESGGTSFSDVSNDAWYAGSIAAAIASGLIEGSGNGIFNPDAPLTREQLATLVVRALQASGSLASAQSQNNPGNSDWTDRNEISEWARDAVAILADAGIVHGFADGSFGPGKTTTRAQAAVMLKRMLVYCEFINP